MVKHLLKRLSPLAVAPLVALYALWFFCSCQSIQAPPGYIASGTGAAAGRIEFPRGQTTEASYALLRWYVEQQEEVTDSLASAALAVAGNAAVECANELRLSVYVRLQRDYPEVVSLRREEGSFAVNGMVLANRSDWSAMEKMLDDIETQVVTPHWVTVPMDEAIEFLKNDQRHEMITDFQLWCVGHSRLQLSQMPDAEELLQQLKDIREALRQKQALLSAMAAAEAKLDSAATAVEAQRILQSAEKDYPTMDAVLAAIGDEATGTAFSKALAEAPRRWVEVTLQELGSRLAAGEALDELEALMSATLPQWGEAGAFVAGTETEERCREAVQTMLGRRESELLGRMELMASRKDFWGAAQLLDDAQRRYVAPGVPETACYSFFNSGEFAARLGERLRNSFIRMLPDAFHFYQVAQDAALNVDNRFALVLAYDECFRRLASAMEVSGTKSQLPAAVREALGRSHGCVSRARQMLDRLMKPRSIVVEAESAELSAMLRAELDKSLVAAGLVGFFRSVDSSAGANSLRLKQIDLQEGCAPQAGMPQKSTSERQVPNGAGSVLVTSVRNVLVADVRLIAQVEQGGKALRTLETERQCTQEFIKESVDGTSAPVLPEKFLRIDREWTAKEVLESTRVQASHALCEKLLDYLRETAPEELAAQSEELVAQGRLLDAANRLSEARLLAGLFPQPRNDFRDEAMKRIAALLAEAFQKETKK